ncbi:hypothetical protein ACWDUH_02450 [Micromonospora wenchangensis]
MDAVRKRYVIPATEAGSVVSMTTVSMSGRSVRMSASRSARRPADDDGFTPLPQSYGEAESDAGGGAGDEECCR